MRRNEFEVEFRSRGPGFLWEFVLGRQQTDLVRFNLLFGSLDPRQIEPWCVDLDLDLFRRVFAVGQTNFDLVAVALLVASKRPLRFVELFLCKFSKLGSAS